MNAGVLGSVVSWERSVFALLRRELAPTRARWRAAGRVLVGSLFAIALTMSLHIPQGEFLLVTLFVVSQTDAWASLNKAALRVIGTIVGGLVGIGGIIVFAEQPWFLFGLQGLVVFVALFLSRTTTAPYAAIIGGMTFILIAPAYVSEPAFNLETGLWRMALTALAAVIGTVTQMWLWPAHPENLLLDDLTRRLEKVEHALDRLLGAGGEPLFSRDPVAAVGMAGQLDLLASAESMSRWLRQRHAEQVTLIVEVQRIVSSAIRMERTGATSLPADAAPLFTWLRDECRRMRLAIEMDKGPTPCVLRGHSEPPRPLSRVELELFAAGLEMEEGIERMSRHLAFLDVPLDMQSPAREPLGTLTFFTPDCNLGNREVLRFALKGALGASICALLYDALHWPQISTCVLTCLVVAQTTVGAGRRRALLRLIGALVGGLGALIAILVFIPNMTSLASLLVVTGFLFGAAAWVVTGSSRISYVGMQMAIVLSLLLINGLAPMTSLEPWRDRLFGVFLGITVMGAIDASIWPVFARDTIREKLAQALDAMATLQRNFAVPDDAVTRHSAVVVYRRLAEALALEDEVLAEPEWQEEEAEQRRLALRLTSVMQDVFLAELAARRHYPAIAAAQPPAALMSDLAELIEDIAQRLDSFAAGLRAGHVAVDVPPPSPAAVDALRAFAGADAEIQAAVVVLGDLVTLVPQLRLRAATLS